MAADHASMHRRTALKLLFAGLAALPLRPRLAAAAEALPHTIIGFSQGGLPLVVHHLGDGPRRVLLLGGQHGGPEANTIDLAGSLLEHFADHPEELPPGLGLDVLVTANPDGAQVGSRQFLSGIDPNRNWGGPDWQTDAWDSNARFRTGLGGPAPFSEQETRFLRDFVLARRPELVVNYHSVGGFLFGSQAQSGADLGAAYAAASGYFRPTPGGAAGGGGSRVLAYRATGTMASWQREQGIAGIFIELGTSYDPELRRNLAGLRAVLPLLGSA